MCFLFHKWGKWEEYRNEWKIFNPMTRSEYIQYEVRQKRKCDVCGKIQDEWVRGM